MSRNDVKPSFQIATMNVEIAWGLPLSATIATGQFRSLAPADFRAGFLWRMTSVRL
jgi:hypothetical protein